MILVGIIIVNLCDAGELAGDVSNLVFCYLKTMYFRIWCGVCFKMVWLFIVSWIGLEVLDKKLLVNQVL